jgi:hypothetical protein
VNFLLNFHLGKSFKEEGGYWDAFSMQLNPTFSIKLPQEEKKKVWAKFPG